MPILKSALKKMRQAKKRSAANVVFKLSLKKALDEYKKKPSPSLFAKASSLLDKAAKKNIIHKNKASRLKSRLSKRMGETKVVAPKAPAKKKASKA